MSTLTKKLAGVATIALTFAVGAGNAQAQVVRNADDACRDSARNNFKEFAFIGKAFSRTPDLGCSFSRADDGSYSPDATKFDLTRPGGPQTYDRAVAQADAQNRAQQRIQGAQQHREEVQNNPIRQLQGAVQQGYQAENAARGLQNLGNGLKNLLGR